MRQTSRTQSMTSMSRGPTSPGTPTAPSTVCDAPVERWTSNPIATSRSITCWICSSFAPSCMTTTIATHIPSPLPGELQLTLLFHLTVAHHRALYRTRFVQNALEQPPAGRVRQRSWIGANHYVQDLILALGLIERLPQRAPVLCHFHDALSAPVQYL